MIREKDNGAAELILRLRRKVRLHVGLVGPSAQAKHSKAKMSVAELGVIHEFGTGTIPQRSFVRDTVDTELAKAQGLMRKIAEAVFRGIAPEAAARRMGEQMVEAMKARIDANIPPPLSPVTVKRKGHDLALVETGQLRAALSYEVERG